VLANPPNIIKSIKLQENSKKQRKIKSKAGIGLKPVLANPPNIIA
jgi:hypothetical protein